jgi:hypothetical protein
VDSSDISAAKDLKGFNFLCPPKEQILALGSIAATLILEILIFQTTPPSQRGRGQMIWYLWMEGNN